MTRKERLPEELRWPVRAADVHGVAEQFGNTVSIHWTTWRTSDLKQPLTVDWTPDDLQIAGVSVLTHASIWIRPVATADGDWVHQALIESVISDAVRWLDHALAAGAPWQSMRHERTWTIARQHLHAIDADGMQIIDRERGTGKNKQR